jgi:hypothetical protein
MNKVTVDKPILLFLLTLWPAHGQTVRTFEGIHASQIAGRQHDVDPNGAVGTKQYLEWVNVAFQGYDKTTFLFTEEAEMRKIPIIGGTIRA